MVRLKGDQDISAQSENGSRWFGNWRSDFCWAILAVMLFSIIFNPFLQSMDYWIGAPPIITLDTTTDEPFNSNHSLIHQATGFENTISILNESPFVSSLGWWLDAYRSSYRVTEEGTLITLRGIFYGQNQHTFTRQFVLPIQNLSQIISHFDVYCLAGTPTATFSIYLQREGSDIPNIYHPDARVSYTFQSGASKLLELNLDLTQLDFTYETPYCEVWISLNITCSFESIIRLESFDFSTKTSNHLAKAIIDFQDYYGNSIFSNPLEGVLLSYYLRTYFEEVVGESRFFDFYPRKSNETFLVLPGAYDVKSVFSFYDRLSNLTFTPDETSYLIIRCNVARTKIVVEPFLPSIYVSISYHVTSYRGVPNNAYYYLPKESEITVLPGDSFGIRQMTERFAHIELPDPNIVSANLTYDYEPILIIGSFSTIPRILFYAFYIVLIYGIFYPRLKTMKKSKYFARLETPAGASVILFLVSTLLPWMSFRLGGRFNYLIWLTLPFSYYYDERGYGIFSTEPLGSIFGQSLTFFLIGTLYLLIYGFMLYRLLGDYRWVNSRWYTILLGVLSTISLISVFFPFMPYQKPAIGGFIPLLAFILALYSKSKSTITPK